MQSSKDLIKIMKHNFSVNSKLEKIPVLMVLADNIALLRDVAFLFAITINIMVLLSFKYYSEDKDAKSENRCNFNFYNGNHELINIIILFV